MWWARSRSTYGFQARKFQPLGFSWQLPRQVLLVLEGPPLSSLMHPLPSHIHPPRELSLSTTRRVLSPVVRAQCSDFPPENSAIFVPNFGIFQKSQELEISLFQMESTHAFTLTNILHFRMELGPLLARFLSYILTPCILSYNLQHSL